MPRKHLSWDNFRSSVLVKGEERVHRISDSPLLEIYGDGARNRIGVWVQIALSAQVPVEAQRLIFLDSRVITVHGVRVLELSTGRQAIHRHFYHFAVAVSERMLAEGLPAADAVILELTAFSQLLEEKTVLGIERQLGLLGELLVLDRLVSSAGPDAVTAWMGPRGEPHDFRVGTREFEVKTTVRAARVHTINGVEQLIPSAGCSLYLLSVLLAPAGSADGFSLPEIHRKLRSGLARHPNRLSDYLAAVEQSGYRDEDVAQYERRFVLRRPFGLVAVRAGCPAITRFSLQSLLGAAAARVESVQYDLNVDGLEVEDGTREFTSILPA